MRRKPKADQRRRDLCDAAIAILAAGGVDLLGGTSLLTERAAAHVNAGRPLQALHLTDIVLTHSPADADVLGVKRQALEQLLAASGRENHSEVQWLEQEIKSATVKED